MTQRTFASEKEFTAWNEEMFKKHTNERCFTHPNPLLRYVEQQRLKYLLKYSAITENDQVLEVGCGSGYILNLIDKGELHGIDLSNAAITWAKDKLKHKPNVKHLSVQPAEKMTFPDNSFDVVFCSEVIEHVPDPQKLLAEIFRVAKPDARIVITFPNEGFINFCKRCVKTVGLYKLILPGIPEHMEDEWHLTEFSKKLFIQLTADNFFILKMKPIPWFFAPLRYAALIRKKHL